MVKTAQCSSVSGAHMNWIIGVSDIQIASISVSNAVIS
jgi:hypothetical protein